jgi:hypothetical protein
LIKASVTNLALILVDDECLAVRDGSLHATSSVVGQVKSWVALCADVRVCLDLLTILNIDLRTSASRYEESWIAGSANVFISGIRLAICDVLGRTKVKSVNKKTIIANQAEVIVGLVSLTIGCILEGAYATVVVVPVIADIAVV